MKKIKKLSCLLIIAALLLAFSGCSSLLSAFEDDSLRENTEGFINAILENDPSSAYAFIDDHVGENDFNSFYENVRALLSGVNTYTLELISAHVSSSLDNGVTTRKATAAYKMTANGNVYAIDCETVSGSDDLSAFYISPFENTDYYTTGSLSSMKGANAFQWIMLLTNVIAIALTVMALIDCIKRSIKFKPVWILFIVFGFLTVGFASSAQSFRLVTNISWITSYSAYIVGGAGSATFRLMIPLGAIIYLAVKKAITKKPAVTEISSVCDTTDTEKSENTDNNENTDITDSDNNQ